MAAATAVEGAQAVIACGPLPPPRFGEALGRRFGDRFLSFYDAIAPAVWATSIDDGTDRERAARPWPQRIATDRVDVVGAADRGGVAGA